MSYLLRWVIRGVPGVYLCVGVYTRPNLGVYTRPNLGVYSVYCVNCMEKCVFCPVCTGGMFGRCDSMVGILWSLWNPLKWGYVSRGVVWKCRKIGSSSKWVKMGQNGENRVFGGTPENGCFCMFLVESRFWGFWGYLMGIHTSVWMYESMIECMYVCMNEWLNGRVNFFSWLSMSVSDDE